MATAMASLPNWNAGRRECEDEIVPCAVRKLGKFVRCVRLPRKQLVIVAVARGLLGAVVEFLIGYFVRKSKGSMCSISASEDVHDTFQDGVSEAEQEKEFRYLTSNLNRDQP